MITHINTIHVNIELPTPRKYVYLAYLGPHPYTHTTNKIKKKNNLWDKENTNFKQNTISSFPQTALFNFSQFQYLGDRTIFRTYQKRYSGRRFE